MCGNDNKNWRVAKMENTKTTIKTSTTKIGAVVSVPKKPESVVIQRRVSCETIGKELTSRITGKLIGFDDLFDPATKTFKTEDELKAVGATFITVSLNKVLGDSDCVKKSRSSREPTPYIRKTSKYQVIGNVNWTSFINKRGHGNFVSAEQRSNGVENFENCKAIGVTRANNFTINGVAFRVLESTKYFKADNTEYSDTKALEADYLKKQSKASKQKEADKHGIEVQFDPKYRTTRIDSCDSIRAFGFDYIPTE